VIGRTTRREKFYIFAKKKVILQSKNGREDFNKLCIPTVGVEIALGMARDL